VLTEIDSRTLALAMKAASEAIREKVRKNLSRRAREALDEEMEFLTDATQAQLQEAQKQLTDAIQRLDLAGELTFETE
jgi:flagellar motor switch protein FliG